MPEQRVVLKDEAYAALPRRHVRDVFAMQRNAPMIDARESGDRSQQRALAAAARTEQHEELAFGDVDRDVVDDRGALIPFGNLIEGNGHRARTLAAAQVAGSVKRGL